MGDFVFCYGSHNRKRLSKYIKKTNNSYRLYLEDDYYIKIKIETRTNRKYIVVDFNDSLDFINFIVRKKICCNSKNKHSCSQLKLYSNYFNYITQHKHYDIIKIFYKKFIPLIKYGQNLKILYFLALQNIIIDIDLDVVKYIFKCGSLEDVKPYFIHVLSQSDNITIEFMDDIISMYKKKLIGLFPNNKILEFDPCETRITLHEFLIPAYKKDDVNLFDFIVEKMCNITSEIDKTKLYKKQLRMLERFEFEFDTTTINHIFAMKLGIHFPEIFKHLLFKLESIDLLNKAIIQDILNGNMVEYMGIICDFIGDYNPELINILLIKANSTEMGQLLIDYGADYEKLYRSTSFKNCSDCVKKLVKKIIKETSDS